MQPKAEFIIKKKNNNPEADMFCFFILQESTGLIPIRAAPSMQLRSSATWRLESPASSPGLPASLARIGGPARARTANTSGSERQ